MKRANWMRAGSMAACAALATMATGDLIVYEGFDCGATNNTRMDGLVGATSFGFDSGSVWTNASVSGTNVYRTAGRTFGQAGGASLLRTVGGSVYGYAAYKPGTNEWRSARLSRPLDVTANTVWGSLLVERDYGSRCIHSLLVGQSTTASDGTAELDVGAREFWGQSQGAIRIKGRQQKLSGTGTGDDTTYLVLFKVDRLNAASGSTVATQWILTNAQYAYHKAGGLTEAELDTAPLGTAAAQVLQRGSVTNTAPAHALPVFNGSSHLLLLSAVDDWSTVGAYYDEIRISNASLDETVPLGPGIGADNSAGGFALAPNSAALRGSVVSPGEGTVDVYVFWGQTDGGTSPGDWDTSILVASDLSGSAAVGTNLSHVVTGFAQDMSYRYRFAVSNAVDGLVFAPSSAFAAGMFSTDGFRRRMPIDFSGYAGTQVLTNFPALVRFTSAQLGSSAAGNGNDLRFTDADGAPLDFEIEAWDATDGWNVWVRIPLLTSATRIWAYSGNTEVSGYSSYYARQGGAWSPEFRGVWHLGEDVVDNQTTGVHADATANGLRAIQKGNAPMAGMVGRAQRLERAKEYGAYKGEAITVTNGAAAALDLTSSFTVSAWFRWVGTYPSATSGLNAPRLICRKNASGTNAGWDTLTGVASPNNGKVYARGGSSATTAIFDGSTSLVGGSWTHMTVDFAGTLARLYLNGTQVGSALAIDNASDNNYGVWIGNMGDGNQPWNGDIDEVRIESVRRSAEWIWAVWKNMADNMGFQTYGPVESLGGTLILIR